MARWIPSAASAIAAVFMIARGHAQSPAFEAASVKVSRANTYNSRGNPERLMFSGIPMRFLVGRAYGLELPDYSDRVSGPGWIDTQRYDVNAKTPSVFSGSKGSG